VFHFIGLKLLAVVLGLALLEGGRCERLVALTLSVQTTLFWIAGAWQGPTDTVPLCLALQALVLLPIGWLAAVYRTRWLWTLLVLQLVVAALWIPIVDDETLYRRYLHWPLELLDCAKAACLAVALAWRWLMPPRAAPDQEAARAVGRGLAE
jgi:hypothetical protein